jgi:hypothetical protein
MIYTVEINRGFVYPNYLTSHYSFDTESDAVEQALSFMKASFDAILSNDKFETKFYEGYTEEGESSRCCSVPTIAVTSTIDKNRVFVFGEQQMIDIWCTSDEKDIKAYEGSQGFKLGLLPKIKKLPNHLEDFDGGIIGKEDVFAEGYKVLLAKLIESVNQQLKPEAILSVAGYNKFRESLRPDLSGTSIEFPKIVESDGHLNEMIPLLF